MKDGHAGVGIGSEITGGCENVWVENCKMDSPNLTRVIRIKSNPERGGEVKNLYVRNVEVGVCDLAVLGIEQKYWYTPTGPYMPYFHDFYFENVKSSGSKYALHIDGHEGTAQVENIYMKNCRFDNVSMPEHNMIIGTRNILLDNVYINGEKQPSER
jgi:polygalacturonase